MCDPIYRRVARDDHAGRYAIALVDDENRVVSRSTCRTPRQVANKLASLQGPVFVDGRVDPTLLEPITYASARDGRQLMQALRDRKSPNELKVIEAMYGAIHRAQTHDDESFRNTAIQMGLAPMSCTTTTHENKFVQCERDVSYRGLRASVFDAQPLSEEWEKHVAHARGCLAEARTLMKEHTPVRDIDAVFRWSMKDKGLVVNAPVVAGIGFQSTEPLDASHAVTLDNAYTLTADFSPATDRDTCRIRELASVLPAFRGGDTLDDDDGRGFFGMGKEHDSAMVMLFFDKSLQGEALAKFVTSGDFVDDARIDVGTRDTSNLSSTMTDV